MRLEHWFKLLLSESPREALHHNLRPIPHLVPSLNYGSRSLDPHLDDQGLHVLAQYIMQLTINTTLVYDVADDRTVKSRFHQTAMHTKPCKAKQECFDEDNSLVERKPCDEA